jgi:hypothetical protein
MAETKKRWLILLSVVIMFAGCRKENPWYEPTELSSQQAVDQSGSMQGTELPGNLVDGAVANDGWSAFSFGERMFLYPQDWNVEVLPREGASDLEVSIRVRNTVKQVLFGAVVLPDDYFQIESGEKVVNVEKYALDYGVIQVDVYRNQFGKSWSRFFRDNYADVVLAFEPVQSDFLPEKIDAVRVTKISGIALDESRIFVRKGDFVYDIALIIQNENPLPLLRVFNAFLQGFQF